MSDTFEIMEMELPVEVSSKTIRAEDWGIRPISAVRDAPEGWLGWKPTQVSPAAICAILGDFCPFPNRFQVDYIKQARADVQWHAENLVQMEAKGCQTNGLKSELLKRLRYLNLLLGMRMAKTAAQAPGAGGSDE